MKTRVHHRPDEQGCTYAEREVLCDRIGDLNSRIRELEGRSAHPRPAAKVALIAVGGIGEEAAKKIVLAIRAGEIPAVTLTY